MKNYVTEGEGLYPNLRKLFLKMKLTAFILILIVFQSFAESTLAQGKFSLDVKNKTVEEVLLEIENQSDFGFMYNKDLVDVTKKVNIDVKNASIDMILDQLFPEENVSFHRVNNQIVISPKFETVQQQSSISGTVTDESDEPLPGVTVVVKGTTQGTVTNANGEYSLTNIPKDATLQFSFVGMKQQVIEVGNQTKIDITMLVDAVGLEEVVAIGYGVVKKNDLTGAVSSVKADLIQKTPTSRLDQALQGKAAGVFVTSVDGSPGGGTTIRIRGGNSITAGNEPLYVIDGFIGGGDLNSINPEDIESIEILKDASAISIYGSRGSNGVILITTKRGKTGKGIISYHTYYGMQKLPKYIDMLNGREFAELLNELADYDGLDPIYTSDQINTIGEGTNWQKEGTQIAPKMSHTLSFSGGSENTKIFASANYFDQDGIIKGSGIKRYQMRTNIDHQLKDFVKLGANINVSYVKKELSKTDIGSLVTLPPTDPVYDEDGNYNIFRSQSGLRFSNPLADIEYNTDHELRNRILAGLFTEITFLKDFTFRPSVNVDLSNYTHNEYYPGSHPLRSYDKKGGEAKIEKREVLDFLTENTLTFKKTLGNKHRINAVAGFTYQNHNLEESKIVVDKLFTDATLYNAVQLSAPDQRNIRSGAEESSLISLLGRLNYVFNDKYMVTLTARRDGSSKFGENNKWAFFPSAALAWRMEKEPFIKNLDIFSKLKLRASYGFAGNQGVNAYQTLGALKTTKTVFGGIEYVGLTQSRLPNPDLKWETTEQLDLGLEASFLDGCLSFEFDYYKKRTEDLLFDVELPFQVGFDSQLRNVGVVENNGFEFLVNFNIINTADWKWDVNLNVSHYKNKVVQLADGVKQMIIRYSALPYNNPISALIPGQPVGAFVGLDYLGTWTQEEIDANGSAMPGVKPGDQKYANYDDNPLINNDDTHPIGDPNPDFFGGLTTNLKYKRFEFSAFFQASVGNDLYNTMWHNLAWGATFYNNYALVKDRWTEDNSNSDIPRVGADKVRSSTASVHDGSFVRLKTLHLGYNIPLRSSNIIKNMNVYVTCDNLWLMHSKSFKGFDPEVNSEGTNTLKRGFYATDYPQSRSAIIGVKIDF